MLVVLVRVRTREDREVSREPLTDRWWCGSSGGWCGDGRHVGCVGYLLVPVRAWVYQTARVHVLTYQLTRGRHRGVC